ncbi:MAG: hypothetical protein BME94_02095 [Methanobacteriales archaeon Met13]
MTFNILKTYYEVSRNQRSSKLRKAILTPANLSEVSRDSSLELSQKSSLTSNGTSDNWKKLWREHQRILELSWDQDVAESYQGASLIEIPDKLPHFSFMDLKIMIAEKIFQECILCPQKCQVDRNLEPGSCGVTEPRISSEFLHIGEEPPLVPSHTVFFSGCNLNCVFCQNYDISTNPQNGKLINPSALAHRIDQRRREGSRNVNFVGGDPAPNLLYILKTMQLTRENIPVVWNSNMYLSQESMKLLDGFADLYLTDFKYGNDECALMLSGVTNYMGVVAHNHKLAKKAGDVIIRHLILPGHGECCSMPILKWVYKNLGSDVVLNIMGQYQPLYQAFRYSDIFCMISPREVGAVVDYAKDLGFRNIIN